MRHVELGPVIDPRRYLEELPQLLHRLPPKAREFASDPDHYDFYSARCIKDLKVGQFLLVDDADTSLELLLEPNEWKHITGLTIRYSCVTRISLVSHEQPPLGPKRLGSIILDEVLPDPAGCMHEIALTGGSITIVAADLDAFWLEQGFLADK